MRKAFNWALKPANCWPCTWLAAPGVVDSSNYIRNQSQGEGREYKRVFRHLLKELEDGFEQ